jgi:hypothetical protein
MRASLDFGGGAGAGAGGFVNNTCQSSNFLPLGMMAAALKKDLAERKWQYCDA